MALFKINRDLTIKELSSEIRNITRDFNDDKIDMSIFDNISFWNYLIFGYGSETVLTRLDYHTLKVITNSKLIKGNGLIEKLENNFSMDEIEDLTHILDDYLFWRKK